jgi:hypothetical protein
MPEPLGWTPTSSPRTKWVVAALVVLFNVPLLHYFFFRSPPAITAQVPWRDDFSDPSRLAATYASTGGLWRVQNGELIAPGVKNNPLFLRAAAPRDVAIDVDARLLTPEGDVRLELAGDGVEGGSGYELVHGAFNNGRSAITRFGIVGTPSVSDRLVAARAKGSTATSLEELAKEGRFRADQGLSLEVRVSAPTVGRTVHHHVERVGPELRWYLDGTLAGQFIDPFPLEGPRHDRVGLSGWEGTVAFDNLVVTALAAFSGGAPSTVTPGPFTDDFNRTTLGAIGLGWRWPTCRWSTERCTPASFETAPSGSTPRCLTTPASRCARAPSAPKET